VIAGREASHGVGGSVDVWTCPWGFAQDKGVLNSIRATAPALNARHSIIFFMSVASQAAG
jgi:hypothetical protein